MPYQCTIHKWFETTDFYGSPAMQCRQCGATVSKQRYDIEVEGTNNIIADIPRVTTFVKVEEL